MVWHKHGKQHSFCCLLPLVLPVFLIGIEQQEVPEGAHMSCSFMAMGRSPFTGLGKGKRDNKRSLDEEQGVEGNNGRLIEAEERATGVHSPMTYVPMRAKNPQAVSELVMHLATLSECPGYDFRWDR